MPDGTDHKFGGPWTEVKLDAISEYLSFYNAALQHKPWPHKPFKRWYVDAFAGSGERVESRTVGGLFDGGPERTEIVTRKGSARRALAVTPPFHHLIFIENDPGRFNSLCGIKSESPTRDIICVQGDANAELLRIFTSTPWSHQTGGRGGHRAVVFLDPYGMEVQWATLKALADTGAVDVWYLFPLHAAVRQLARDYSAVDESKRRSLNEVFGTEDWQSELYSFDAGMDLFKQPIDRKTRTATPRQIEAYAMARLETVFVYVSDPLPLLLERGAQLFSLFCATGNHSRAAHDLIRKGVKHVLTKFGPASRRTSGHVVLSQTPSCSDRPIV